MTADSSSTSKPPAGKFVPAGAAQHKTAGPYSPVLEVQADRLVVISGQVAVDPDGNILGDTIEEQTRATLENCRRQLETAGCTFHDVFKVNAYMADVNEWDRFNDRRDADLNRAVSPKYVSQDIYGTEELDANGSWTYDPSYGNVWVPRVAAGWAPYRDGRWVYEPYYGWTWVSADPWGWAPYHYGRWYQGSFGWAWYPGPIGGRHYWRPALVGFFGWAARLPLRCADVVGASGAAMAATLCCRASSSGRITAAGAAASPVWPWSFASTNARSSAAVSSR